MIIIIFFTNAFKEKSIILLVRVRFTWKSVFREKKLKKIGNNWKLKLSLCEKVRKNYSRSIFFKGEKFKYCVDKIQWTIFGFEERVSIKISLRVAFLGFEIWGKLFGVEKRLASIQRGFFFFFFSSFFLCNYAATLCRVEIFFTASINRSEEIYSNIVFAFLTSSPAVISLLA